MKFLYLTLFLFLSVANAREYKSVFDCSSSDAQYVASRMALVEKTMSMMQKGGDDTKFALTLHGDCVAMVSKSYEEITADEDMKYVKKAQDKLVALSKETTWT